MLLLLSTLPFLLLIVCDRYCFCTLLILMLVAAGGCNESYGLSEGALAGGLPPFSCLDLGSEFLPFGI